MAKEGFIDTGFLADRSVVDSLKIEGSLLTPVEDKKSQELAGRITTVLLTKYGRFMPQAVRDTARTIPERVMVFGEKAFEVMWEDWEVTTEEEERGQSQDIHGAYFTEGQLMVTKDPLLIFDAFTHEGQEEYIKKEGSEQKAREHLGKIEETDKAHEIIHDLHTEDLPEEWMECGTSYYERMVGEELKLRRAILELQEMKYAFYRHTVNTFGDDVHRLFFGTEIEEEQRNRILGSMTENDKNRLFPDGYGLIK